jgi:geranylgeranyl diphosphate synthase type II
VIGMSKEVEEFLKQNIRKVDELILNFLPENHEVKEIDLLYKMMRDYPLRPKKGLRSSLCILTCLAFGGKFDKVLPTAAALEIFQNWVLIHDDIEDESKMRRGKLVLHKLYNLPLALNAGDALHVKMWELLISNKDLIGYEKTYLVLQDFVKMVNETTEGQHMELSWVSENRWDLDEKDYMLMCEKKSAWYTCISPCRLGSIIAGTNNDELFNNFYHFGRNLGIAFQIKDDVLNLVGDSSKYGKEIAGDIVEGKRTLIMIELLKRCSEREKEEVIKIMNLPREKRKFNEISRIIELIKKHGCLEYALKRANELANEAVIYFDKAFGSLPDSNAKSILKSLVKFMVERKW